MREFTDEEKEALHAYADNQFVPIQGYGGEGGLMGFGILKAIVTFETTHHPFRVDDKWYRHIRLSKKHPMSEERIIEWCINTPRAFATSTRDVNQFRDVEPAWKVLLTWQRLGHTALEMAERIPYRGTVNEDGSLSALETWEE